MGGAERVVRGRDTPVQVLPEATQGHICPSVSLPTQEDQLLVPLGSVLFLCIFELCYGSVVCFLADSHVWFYLVVTEHRIPTTHFPLKHMLVTIDYTDDMSYFERYYVSFLPRGIAPSNQIQET